MSSQEHFNPKMNQDIKSKESNEGGNPFSNIMDKFVDQIQVKFEDENKVIDYHSSQRDEKIDHVAHSFVENKECGEPFAKGDNVNNYEQKLLD